MAARVLAFLLLLCASRQAAVADERADAREHYLKGTKAFDLGRYDEAIREYVSAYEAKDDPALLYNIAQAHRLAGHAEEALRFYKTYLSKLPHAANRDEVEQKISELRALVEQQQRSQTSLPPDQPIKPLGTAPAVEAPPSAAPAAPAIVAPAPEPKRPAGRAKKIAGLIVGVAGVGLVAAGIAFGVLAQAAGDDLTKLAANMRPWDPAKQSDGQTDQALEGALLGVGAAAVVTAVVLYAVGAHEARAARRISAAPSGNGLTVHY
jgi:tetratricopeptide (TPR) repeat protein